MSRETILVIEDEEDIQELIRYNLAKEGYRVHCVDEGEEGVEIARTAEADLIVLDLMLPGIDGLETCRRIKKNLPLHIFLSSS
jgi:two-component system phosphate regulon response regulator PhoB